MAAFLGQDDIVYPALDVLLLGFSGSLYIAQRIKEEQMETILSLSCG